MDAYNLLSLRLQPSLNCWRVFRDLCILLWVRARPRWFRRLAFCCAVREGIAWRLLSSGTWPVMGIFCLAIIMTTLSIDWCNCWQTLGLLSCCTVRKTSWWQLLTDAHCLYCACSLLCIVPVHYVIGSITNRECDKPRAYLDLWRSLFSNLSSNKLVFFFHFSKTWLLFYSLSDLPCHLMWHLL